MPRFTVIRRVNFPPQQIFAVVADVGSYEEFLPLVERSTVRNRKPPVDDYESFSADLVIGHKKMGIHESFSSQVETSLENLSVSAVSSGNAVKKLISSWQITPVEDGKSDITFAVDYEMKSPMLQLLMKGMFDMAARKIISAFEARAEKLYKS
ncbi:MAG: type II toxin-antitoxin system RatA family toxin [Aestuariivirga sp.]|nr:type II toxin-antitoxin system RatA family toxin [Aestuariivirga sp.]